ncbi:MAG TPA: septum formation initiator family protein [Mariprofundaceae bacterium]|nr:septum formation initiator family protein [Mariprofundaceae bacterium]
MRWAGMSLALLVIGWMVWDLVFSDHGYLVYRSEKAELQQLRDEVEALKIRRQKLGAEILRLRNDPKALEELVHRELGYVYPDEYMLILPEGEKDSVKKATK